MEEDRRSETETVFEERIDSVPVKERARERKIRVTELSEQIRTSYNK